jgi:segregation and condensation protein B
MNELARIIEALLFLSAEPLSTAELAAATECEEEEVRAALVALGERHREGSGGILLRELAGGYTFLSDPIAEPAARRHFGRERKATLTGPQAETLAIVAYLQPVSRPEIARIRGVSADWAVNALLERDLIEEAGRSELGATLYRTTRTFLKHFGLSSLSQLPDISHWDPTPQEAGQLRERLLRAGDARAGMSAQELPSQNGAQEEPLQPRAQKQPLQPRAQEQPLQAGAQEPAGQAAEHGAPQEAPQRQSGGLPLDRWERELLSD